MENAKLDAMAYILTALLQRLDDKHPGLLNDLIKGVQSDQAALPKGAAEHEHVHQVFTEAMDLLARADFVSNDPSK